MRKFLKLIYVFLIVIFAFGVVGIFYSINQKDTAAASTVINNAGDPGAIPGFGRQVVRSSTGTLYMDMRVGSTCEIWKSTDGTSWSEVDSAHHPTCGNGSAVWSALAIDSNNTLHYIYPEPAASSFFYYVTMSSDTFGTPEVVTCGTADNFDMVAIAVDSNNKPHASCSQSGDGVGGGVFYTNRVSGSWKAAVTVLSDTAVGHTNYATMAIDKDNLPEIAWIKTSAGTGTSIAAVGNLNDATSFTSQNLDTTVNSTAGTLGTDIAIDSSGNTWVTYVDTTGPNINLIKHVYGDAWNTWQTAATDSHTGKEPSLGTNGTSDVYVFYQNSADDIAYDKYTGSWGGETTVQTGTFQDVHVKFSYLNNNQGSTQIDYLFSDNTDIYWDKLTLAVPGPDKVAFANGARTLTYNACNGDASVFTMQLQLGTTPTNPLASTVVRVTSDSSSYTVYSDSTCTTVATNGDFTFSTSENSKSVYIKDTGSTGTHTLTGTRQSGDTLTTGTQNYTLIAAPAVILRGGSKIQAGTKIQ